MVRNWSSLLPRVFVIKISISPQNGLRRLYEPQTTASYPFAILSIAYLTAFKIAVTSSLGIFYAVSSTYSRAFIDASSNLSVFFLKSSIVLIPWLNKRLAFSTPIPKTFFNVSNAWFLTDLLKPSAFWIYPV